MSRQLSVEDLAFDAEGLDVQVTAETFSEHGCCVVRGLMLPYIEDLSKDIEATARTSLELLDQAVEIPEGWKTPNGTLFIPAPENYERDRQIMGLALDYFTSSSFLRSALDSRLLDLVEAILGPSVELFGNGQCLYKEPVGGHPKHLHQDSAYFEHKFEGPVGALTYVVDTDLVNGALHVVPGSHNMGQLDHIDTFSHLGLDDGEWPWERALPIPGRAGDTILFHVKTVHGSRENRSETARPVFINRYRRTDDFTTVRGTTTANRSLAEAQAAQVKKENERGLMVRGFRSPV